MALQQFCFLDKERPCNLNCKAAYTSEEENHETIYCTFIFAIDSIGRLADTFDREKQSLTHLKH